MEHTGHRPALLQLVGVLRKGGKVAVCGRMNRTGVQAELAWFDAHAPCPGVVVNQSHKWRELAEPGPTAP